jgi:hypothetical protein
MKPKKWLAYTIEVNDLLPAYEQIIARFEESDIPLDGTFGSNTTAGHVAPGILLAIGPAVEPARLAEVILLLSELGQLFILVHDEASHNKVILIGALNLSGDKVTAITGDVIATYEKRRHGRSTTPSDRESTKGSCDRGAKRGREAISL